MRRRDVLRLVQLVCLFVLSLVSLVIVHYIGDPAWLAKHLPATQGGDGILWQVQTTFLSVGFAGLAIAAQLFAEAPLAIGASRGRVLEYIGASWFVGVGLVANAVIGVETIWFPSTLGLLLIPVLWFVATVVLLVRSSVKLMELFGHPSRLDEVVRQSLVETLSSRLSEVSHKYADATRELNAFQASDPQLPMSRGATATLRVPVPEVGRIIKAIKPKVVQQAIDSLEMRASDEGAINGAPEDYIRPEVLIDITPGDRTRLGQTAFRVMASKDLAAESSGQLARLLQSSIEFEAPGSVTPDEETDREIASLKDAIGVNLRCGALATAERALELLGHVVRGVWMDELERLDSAQRESFIRRGWLFRSIGEAEQDALLSPRVAGIFVSAAMTRALEAPRTGSAEYVDECLRSFTRLWFDILRYGGAEFESLPARITLCVQNLATFSYSIVEEHEDLQARATWALVELVKLALDARKPEAAKMAAEELDRLFEYEQEGPGRSHVLAGQLVLSGWIAYLTDKDDDRVAIDRGLRALVTPRGTWFEILEAGRLAERGLAPFTRWGWWEMESTLSGRGHTIRLPDFVARAQVAALASSYGPLPPVLDEAGASEYNHLLSALTAADKELTPAEQRLKARLEELLDTWNMAENQRLANEPLSETRIERVRTAIRETISERPRLADIIPHIETPAVEDSPPQVLGMNFLIPRQYLVDKVFNRTYADPRDLGRMIAQGFAKGEEEKIVGELRTLQDRLLAPTAAGIRREIEALASDAAHFILLTPYGGLLDSTGDWYSTEFTDALDRVTHIETAELHGEAILFDGRGTLTACFGPEEKAGLCPVADTSIAIGVFEDVPESDHPKVRIETGEYFLVRTGNAPHVLRFASEMTRSQPVANREGSR